MAQHRREIQQYDSISESCARLIVLQSWTASWGASWGRNKCGVSRFLEVSNESSCWLGLNRKKGELARRRRHMQAYGSQTTTPSAFNRFTIAESVLGGSNGWKQMWSSKKVTLRVTVSDRTKKKMAQRRRQFQQYGPQTIISPREFRGSGICPGGQQVAGTQAAS